MSTTTDESEGSEEAPDGWHWGIGERSTGYYDHWLYTDAALYNTPDERGRHFGYEIHLYWDQKYRGDGDHCVELLPITKLRDDGDVEYGYEERIGRYQSEQEAVRAAIEAAKDLR